MLQDRSSQLYIPYVTKTLLLAKLLNVPRFIYAPGLGPVKNSFGKMLSRMALNGSGCIIVRDRGSADFLESIGVQGEEVKLNADPGFSLTTGNDDAPVKDPDEPPVIGIAPRRLFYRKGSVLPVSMQLHTKSSTNFKFYRLIEDTAAALDLLIEKQNAEIRFMPMDIGPNPRDDIICDQIKVAMTYGQKTVSYLDDAPLETFIRRLSELDLLVSARLHGIILGLRYGLPFIGIDSDGKIPQLAAQIDMNHYVIKDSDFSRDQFYDIVCKALENRIELRKTLLAQFSELKLKAQINSDMLKSYLNKISG
jgi:polysaccharide pyruvyl transferase WcaK-like protein